MSFESLAGAARTFSLKGRAPLATRARPQPLVLHWVFGHLRKRGSFEDYLLASARKAARRGLRLHIVARLLIDPDVRAALEAEGVSVECVSDDALNSPAFFARAVLRLRPSLVHCHFGSPSTAQALIAKLLGVRAFVFTDHGSRASLDEATSTSLRYLRRRLLGSFIDLYLPVSDFVGAQVRREVGAPKRKVARLFNGVDLARFHPLGDATERARRRVELLGVEADKRCVFYVGQLTDSKGVDDILAIQDEILRRFDDIAFVWIGDGPLAPEIARNISPRVRYLGLRNDVERLLPAADLILAPSRWHEAFCLTVAEAAACGVPAIATRVGGVPEVVRDGETGLLVNAGDRPALLDACARLLGDEPRRRAMGEAARQRAETSFCLSEMVRATLAHYRALGMPTRDSETTSLSSEEV